MCCFPANIRTHLKNVIVSLAPRKEISYVEVVRLNQKNKKGNKTKDQVNPWENYHGRCLNGVRISR